MYDGVAERDNKAIINMVCCILNEKQILRKFCLKLSIEFFMCWIGGQLLLLKNTHKEALSGFKPSESSTLEFWGVCFMSTYLTKKTMLYGKIMSYVLLDVSEE